MGAEVHRELLVDVGAGRGVDRPRLLLSDAAVVVRSVQSAVQFADPLDGGADAGTVGEIHAHGIRSAAFLTNAHDDPLQGVGAPSGEHDGGPLGREQARSDLSDTAARAGDEDYLPGQQLEAGRAALAEHRADSIVAIGGGSPIDTAKALSVLAVRGGDMRDLKAPFRYEGRPCRSSRFPPRSAPGRR